MDANMPPLEQQTSLVYGQAHDLIIRDKDSHQKSGDLLRGIKSLRDVISNDFSPIIEKAHLAHKEAITQRKKVEAPLIEAENILKDKLAQYHIQQERIRREQEALLQSELVKHEEETRLAEAISLEQSGDTVGAHAVLDAPPSIPSVVIPPPHTVEGVSVRKVWKYLIVNPGHIKQEFLIPNDQVIAACVRQMGLQAERIVGGIQVYQEPIVAVKKS